MLWNLGGHWLIGLPVAYALAFPIGFGVVGLWWGLSLGLIICGVALVAAWWRCIHAVLALLPPRQGGTMAEQKEPPRPHGDPLENERMNTGKSEPEKVDSGATDATNDVVGLPGVEEPTRGTTSDANGLPAGHEVEGEQRRKQYGGGAKLVSRID